MPVGEEYLGHVLDQLHSLGPVRAKRMFGGAGLYLDGRMFGLIADDILYLKVDDSNRMDYESAGTEPFRPFGKAAMPYFEVPADILEDGDGLREWGRKALAVAERALRLKKRHQG